MGGLWASQKLIWGLGTPCPPSPPWLWGRPISVPPAVLELCLSHSLDPVTLANELLAFITSKALDPQLSPEVLSAFEHEVRPQNPSNSPQNGAGRSGGSSSPPTPHRC